MKKLTNSQKKTGIVAAAMAVVLAVAIGGVIAYLQGTSSTVLNVFSEGDQITVSLKETGASSTEGDDSATLTNSSFHIFPGNSETKDPTVSGTATAPAYVFVKVTDQTNNLVNYSIADGWTELESEADAANGVKVYYRVFTPSEGDGGTSYSYEVLKGNKVSYPATLSNTDVASKEGETISLAFKAYAIQVDNINNPRAAYGIVSGTAEGEEADLKVVSTAQTQTQAINASSTETTVFDNVDFTVDTDKLTSNVYINGAYDGTVVFSGCTFSDTDYEYLQATMSGDASIVFSNCDFYVSSVAKRVIHVQPAANNTQKLDITITNCNFYTTENITSDTRVHSGAVADYIDLDYIADGSTLTLGGCKFYQTNGTEITAMDSNPGIYFCATSAHNYAQTARSTMFSYVTGNVTTYTVTNGAPVANEA